MSLLTIIRIAFLVSLGVELLYPNKPCRVVAGVTSLILGFFILTGNF